MTDGQEFDLFGEARRGKLERQRQLAEALIGGQVPDPVVAEVELDLLADAVADRLVGRVGPEPEQERYFDAALTGKAARKAALVATLTGRGGPPAPGGEDSSGFDGGARAGELRRPESHDELVVRLAGERRVHRGGF